MRTFIKQFLVGFTIILLSFSANAEDKSILVEDASAAIQSINKNVHESVSLSNKAAAILVFPKIVRAGFIAGGSGGEGVLFKKGKARGYYSSGSISVGLQAGVQSFGYAVFFMTERGLKAFEKSNGWNIGAAPTVVFFVTFVSNEFNKTTAAKEVYAFVFDQLGLMAGMALQGQKISKIK